MAKDRPTYEAIRATLGVEPLWGVAEVALYLRCSERTVASLPIPRANIGGVKYVPSVVRRWAELQLSYSLPSPTNQPSPDI